METYKLRLEQRIIFQQFIRATNIKVEKLYGKIADLESFLILPVQRIPRYMLLLDALLKFTPPDHPDFNNLTEAIAKVKSVADHLNQAVTIEEHREKIFEIQKRLVLNYIGAQNQNIIAPHRKLLFEGTCQLENTVNGVKGSLYCYLFNDAFAISKVISRKGPLKFFQELTDLIELHTAWVIEDTINNPLFMFPTADACCFGIISPQGNFIIRCTSEVERKKWTNDIINAIVDLIQLREYYMNERRKQFPIFQNKKWTFKIPEDNYPIKQMAKHVVIRASPPPYLVARETQVQVQSRPPTTNGPNRSFLSSILSFN